ncbi:nitroreductase family protein [Slackia isoflavoniconvertens]|uniref:nitroreductase family protein n=1 Tax=Slackia isoflavoniconvertens TaxID=572010 RepID=UPI003AB949B5
MITVETIRERHSVREYDGGPLDQAEFDALGAVVEECARESGLDIQLVGDNPEVFNVIARFGLIRGCRTHVAFVVDDAKAGGATSGANAAANGATEADCVEMRGARRTAVDEAIGYWGQKIVLAAQDMGLNTCWCALCSRKKSRAVVAPGKKVRLVIAVGHGKTQGFSRKTKSVEALSSVECAKTPAWFAAAMEAAQLAPTAMNNQNFKITLLSDGKTVRIDAPKSGLNVIDEGIVRCNFEIAAKEAGAD